MDALEACMHDLHVTAAAVVDDHWQQIKDMEKQTQSWSDKSTLVLAAYRKGNHLQLKWIGTKWYGVKDARRQVKISIPRAKSELTYTMAKLRPWTKEWEAPIVEETERKITSIRKEAHFVVRSIMAIRNAALTEQNCAIESNGIDIEPESDPS
ncbi:conjugative transfer protein MobI(A/C) [Simplicispira suum]|uniref:Uncharacterized protein n=1 Tax=Simplicispira suum TaxID=2109915 RepID=A0A2S0N5Z7_9BURK|nr:conjugative transfer protein MobI(A/C) [Simplicispira suum]AVO43572.1 hypothetical protein C6571_19315 [Simplicispira suum]